MLQVAGEKKHASEQLHKHIDLAFGDMTVEELERLGEHGEWPARYKALADRLATKGTDG